MPNVVLRRSFEWDVLAYPSPNSWLDDLRDQGWTRVPGVPGVTTERGTVVYEFQHPGPASALESDRWPASSRAFAFLLVACAVAVSVIVVAVLVVMSIVQS